MSLENLKKLLEPELLKEVYELMDAARKDTAKEILDDLANQFDIKHVKGEPSLPAIREITLHLSKLVAEYLDGLRKKYLGED